MNIKNFKISAINSLLKKKFIHNVFSLLAGNIAAQIVVLITSPVITRLYTPDQFGIMTFVVAVSGIFSVVACMRYRYAIVIPKENEKAYCLFALSMLITLLISATLLFFVVIYKEPLALRFGLTQNPNYVLFVPFTVFILSALDIFVYFYTRFKKFRLISICTALLTIINSGVKISAGLLFTASAFWLLLGNLIGPLVCLVIFIFVMKGEIAKPFQMVNMAGIKESAYEFRKFPKFNMPTNILNSIAQNFPILFFSYFFPHGIVGFYGLANMVLRRPVNVMTQSISKVFLQKSSEIENNGFLLYDNLKKTTIGLAAIGIIPFVCLAFGGKLIFEIIFGEEWAIAGLYAQLLAPWLFTMMLKTPANQIIFVKQKLEFDMFFNIINITLQIISMAFAYLITKSAVPCLAAFSAVSFSTYSFYIVYTFIFTKKLTVKNL